MIKSMIHKVYLDIVIGNGCSRQVDKDIEYLVFLQISHIAVNLQTGAGSFGHQPRASKE